MNDLDLWQRLGDLEHEQDPVDLAKQIESLVDAPPHARAPFLGHVSALLGHEDAHLRSAGVALLQGCRAQPGVAMLTRALDDEDAGVRARAVHALRKTAAASPQRWAHAVFHPRPDVRRLALDVGAPVAAQTMGAYLRADPDLRALAEQCPWPANPCGLVFDMFLREHVDAIGAGAALAAVHAKDLRVVLRHGVRRPPTEVRDALARFEAGAPLARHGRDMLDLWCRIYRACSDSRPALLRKLQDAVFGRGAVLGARTAYAIMLDGQQLGLLPELLQLAVACRPALLRSPVLAIRDRKAGVLGLANYRERLSRVDPSLVETLMVDLVGQHEPFDLEVAAVLASVGGRRPILALGRIASEEVLVTAAIQTPSAWPRLGELGDDAPLWFLRRMHSVDPDAAARFISTSMFRWFGRAVAIRSKSMARGADRVQESLFDRVVAWLDAATALKVLLACAHAPNDAAGPWARSLPAKATTQIVGRLQSKLDDDALFSLLETLLRWFARDDARAVLQAVLHARPPSLLPDVAPRFDPAALELLCTHPEPLVIPRAQEIALAKALEGHATPPVAAWASNVLAIHRAKPPPTTVTWRAGARALTPAQADTIANADERALPSALAVALGAATRGLCVALGARPSPREPSLHVCVALLGCRDPLPEVSVQLDRFGRPDDAFVTELMPLMVEVWQSAPSLCALGHATLYRWEKHAFALLSWIDRKPGGLHEVLAVSSRLGQVLARKILWEGVSHAVVLRRYRQGERLRAWSTAPVLEILVEHLDTDLGPSAARMLVAFHITEFAVEALAALQDRVVAMMPDMDAATRRELERWVRIDGLKARATPARRASARLGADRIAAVRSSTDIPWLLEACTSALDSLVLEAVVRLADLAGPGQRALAELAARGATPRAASRGELHHGLRTSARPREPTMLALASSLSVWTDDVALDRMRGLARNSGSLPFLRFHVAVGLHDRGEAGWAAVALEATATVCDDAWFEANDWTVLVGMVADVRTVAIAVASAVHPHAYQRAMRWLLDHGADDAECNAALRSFLRAGMQRPTYLRRAAAHRLLERGDASGWVVCVREALDDDVDVDVEFARGDFDAKRHGELASHAVDAALLGGPRFCSERRSLALAQRSTVVGSLRDRLLQRLLVSGNDPHVREVLASDLGRGPERELKLGKVAQVFAWGVRKGRELTGRMFAVHMTQDREDLGYTRMTENTIYVSPLPLLRAERHGQHVVEALILHEYGHHLYHRDAESQRLWKRAHDQGFGSLLNLVADEHLERRLRALDAAYGDRLKRLTAYAFQHSDRELKVSNVLAMLHASAFEALSARPLGAAFEEDSVVVDSGSVLRELDRRGHPVARFVRALRMGLGNRHDDPLLARALALFKGGFRHLEMRGLYEIAFELSLLYGEHGNLAETFGGHESLEWDERGAAVHGAGLGDAEVQQEVERILKPPGRSGGGRGAGLGGSLQINVGPNTHFDPITKVVPVAVDRARHRSIAREVRRHARRLHAYFASMGLAMVPRRARLQGRAFDRTRVQAVVTRRDPRMLVARELATRTDLFIGVVIDCSGSMGTGRSMDKAHRFGVLLAEAVRDLAGVDARFFGFTDREIFDAGDADRCGVTTLGPGGGNNDAAALAYVASVAAASSRRAKLLVMISDGLPTECSVEALRSLADSLTRRQRILCAQVAVRPLTETCFPHYIELTTPELDGAVRRFGEIISRLAHQALAR